MYISDNNKERILNSELLRNSYGKGSKSEEIKVTVPGEFQDKSLEIELSEQEYTDDELKTVFDKAKKKIDSIILGKNKGFDCIQNDMNLVTKIPDESIEVQWELSRYDIMDTKGKLNKENLREEGTLIDLKAVMIYLKNEDKKIEYTISAMVYPEYRNKQAQILQEIKEQIMNNEEEKRSKKAVQLPHKIKGKTIRYNRKPSYRWAAVIFLGLISVSMLILKEKEEQKRKAEVRKRQMMLDYPEIVDKFTLLISSGMTVKKTWYKMVEEYEQSKSRGQRYAYEEMKTACIEMRSGISEAEAYERFAGRCNLQAYLKLGALLSQNLRKGTKGLSELLQLEAIQAFEERKALARRQGEEAGTKLLLPMFFMLSVVLIIVIVPAFLSVKL